MDKSVQVCIKCNTSLAIGLKLHFCPYCGTPQLEKKLLAGKSTQHYDPRDPKFKPWRDKPKIPKREYKPADASSRKPWCPAMRQPRLRPKKIVSVIRYDETWNQAQIQVQDSEMPQTEHSIHTDNIEELDSVVEDADCEEDQLIEPFFELYTEKVSPISMYDAEHWLAVGGMAVNISLVEQTLGDAHHLYWLRIGVMFEDDRCSTIEELTSPIGDDDHPTSVLANIDNKNNEENPTGVGLPDDPTTDEEKEKRYGKNDDDEEGEDHDENEKDGQLYTIAVLSSNVARLMVPSLDDWVDLDVVDPFEYYMARHMEKVLQTIAHRVATTNLNELALRQTYCVQVRRRTKLTKLADALHIVGNGLSAVAVEKLSLLHTSSAAWGYNANQIVCQLVDNSAASMGEAVGEDSSNRRLMSRTSTSISVCFQDWVIQLAHRLALTRGISVRHYPALVRVSFKYEDRLTDPKLFPDASTNSAPSSAGKPNLTRNALEDELSGDAGKYIDPRISERNKKMQYFSSSQRITHAVVSITPSAVSTDTVVPPAELSFDLHSLRHLLRDKAPLDFDEMVADGKKAVLHRFAADIASLVRLECTDAGLKYAVVGAFSEPAHETRGWPLDIPSFMDEDLDDIDDLDGIKDASDDLQNKLVNEVEDCEGEKDLEESPPALLHEVLINPLVPDEVPSAPHSSEEIETEAEHVVGTPRPEREAVTPRRVLEPAGPCPIHPVLCSSSPRRCDCARSHCKCLRQRVSLKGSEVDLWADFSVLDGASSLLGSSGEPYPNPRVTDLETLCLPSTLDAAGCAACSYVLTSVNKLTLMTVDTVDPDLTCTVTLPAQRVTQLLEQAIITAVGSARIDENGNDDDEQGIIREYSVSSGDTAHIDLMKHPALRRLCFDFLCEGSMLDLFLSRKSKLMKLVVK